MSLARVAARDFCRIAPAAVLTARVAKSVDARDLKSLGGNPMSVRVRPRAYYRQCAQPAGVSAACSALKAAGIENFRFHDLRHTGASYLASLLEIADALGHRTMAMVKRHSHLAQGHKTTVVEKMARERGL